MIDSALNDELDYYGEEAATFGDRVAAGREAAKITQADLSRKLGIKLKTLQGWENDMSEPRANKLQMLAGMLNVSIVWLLTGQGEGVGVPEPEVSALTKDLLLELRSIRGDYSQLNDRLARLEKRLKASLSL